jgi:dTDP-4-amino-4,6-dideoxygalactose transaminase
MFAGIDGHSVGSFGDLACFSTYVAHIIVGGVGGLVTTADKGLADMCHSLLAHGRDSVYTKLEDDDNPTSDILERRYKFDRIGYSYRATEIEAAIALSELERWEENIAQRRANAKLLTELLHKFECYLQLPSVPKGFTHSYMMYPMVVKPGVNRDALLLHLEQHGIETRFMFPLLSQPIYKRLFPGLEKKYPVAQHLEKQGFFVGIHQGMNKEDMQYVHDIFLGYFMGTK